MITHDQFKRAKQIESQRDELQKFIDGFSSNNIRTCIGLVGIYGVNSTTGNHDSAGRFRHIQKELTGRLNQIVIDELTQQIEKMNTQLQEHVKS